jgi:AcrR family transcriptional regulator
MGNLASTRERIMARGLELMSQSGLGGVTLGVLADQVGMSKSGLFAHFKSKDEVQIELLEHSAEFGKPRIIDPAMKAPEGLPRLITLVHNWFGWAKKAGLPGGCPVAAGMFEYDDVESLVRDKILDMERQWEQFLASLVRRAVELGHLRKDLDVSQFVFELCGIYLTHHVTQRFLRSPHADRQAETAFQALLERAAVSSAHGETKRRKRAPSARAK